MDINVKVSLFINRWPKNELIFNRYFPKIFLGFDIFKDLAQYLR